jgi:outer membrane scaffolding protein for murein synthesis (MipA/OmpV family)
MMIKEMMMNIKLKALTVRIVAMAVFLPSCSFAGGWGVGTSLYNNPVYQDPDDDVSLSVFPEYHGEQFNMDFESVSYKFFESGNFNLELLGKYESLGYEDNDSKRLKGMKDRDSTLNAGFRASYSTDYGLLSLHAVNDLFGKHKGQEVELRFGEPFYTEHWSGQRELTLGAFVGAKWQSDDLIDYYYGVKVSEVTTDRKAFKGKAAITPFVGLEMKLGFSEHIGVEGMLGYEHLPDKITDSPVASKNGMRARLGLTYWF